MKDKEVNELVKKLDQELSKHNLTFDEYLLYRALHVYENRNPEVMKSLEEKGLIKDEKIVDHSRMDDINKTLVDFLTPIDGVTDKINHIDYMRILSLMYMNRPNGRPW